MIQERNIYKNERIEDAIVEHKGKKFLLTSSLYEGGKEYYLLMAIEDVFRRVMHFTVEENTEIVLGLADDDKLAVYTYNEEDEKFELCFKFEDLLSMMQDHKI